jgi:hypothetical protein
VADGDDDTWQIGDATRGRPYSADVADRTDDVGQPGGDTWQHQETTRGRSVQDTWRPQSVTRVRLIWHFWQAIGPIKK